MAASSSKKFLDQVPRDTISAIDDDLDTLEDILEPLLAHPLEETLEKLSILERAKLQTTIPYVVNDLIIMYLKMNGVSPHDHPVMTEMKRVKAYFEKINEAEHPPQNRFSVDKAAANRFIKSAIATASGPPRLSSNNDPTADPQVIGSHLRFDTSGSGITPEAAAKIAARNEAQQQSSDSDDDSDEEGGLKVTGGDLEPASAGRTTPVLPSSSASIPQAGPGKRKRPAIDPFAGYDSPKQERGTEGSGRSTPLSQTEDTPDSESSNNKKRKSKTRRGKRSQIARGSKRVKDKAEGSAL